MKKILSVVSLTVALVLLIQITVIGQDTEDPSCDLEDLQANIEAQTADLLEENPTLADEFSAEYAYRLGEIYTNYALACNYQPTFPEIESQIDRTLDLAPLSFIIAASSIGNNVDVALAELESVNGDGFNGQLLYNGLEVGLDGAELGCSGCHNGVAAPVAEGIYTRVIEERLTLEAFADYTPEQYFVESILHPSAYIVTEYESVQMPENYGGRLDAQQLADLLAYLSSQDQELESEESATSQENVIERISSIDYTQIMEVLDTVTGDPARGEQLYNGSAETELGVSLLCAGCHTNGVIGPDTIGTWTRILEDRLILEQFADYTPEQYVVEAIIEPDRYIVEGYSSGAKPSSYGMQLTFQELADIIAFLRETTQE